MLYIQIVQFFLYLKYDLVDLKEESMGDATNAMPRNRNLSAHANHPARDILQKHTLTPE